MPFRPYIPHILAGSLTAALFYSTAVADQERALLADGREVTGTLGEDETGRIVFTSPATPEPIPAALVKLVTFDSARAPLSPSKPLWRLKLWAEGQVLTGRVLEFRGDAIRLDLLCLGEREVSPGVLAGIHSPATELTLVYHDFEGVAPGWSGAGTDFRFDRARHLSGSRSMRLEGGQATASYTLPRRIEAGRVELSFWDDGVVDPERQWLVEAEFATSRGPQRVRMILGWNRETFGLEAPEGPSLAVQQLSRRQGWRRLRISFNRLRLLVLIDDAVLTVGEGPRGPLRAIRAVCRPAPTRAKQPSDPENPSQPRAAYLDDFTVHRSVDSLLYPRRQWEQDELLFDSGDQLFGEVRSVDDHRVRIAGPYGTVRVPWSDLRGVLFRRRPIPASPIEGVIVRLRFQSRSESKPTDWDLLEGALESVTLEQLVLRHPYLGTLRVPRDLARELEVVFSGWRLEIDPVYHHLGERGENVDASLPLAEGNRLRAAFNLEDVPSQPAFVSVLVQGLEGTGRGARYKQELEDGHLRTDLYLNDQLIDYLNRHVERRSRVALRLRIPVPAGVLRQGENILELRQQPVSYDKNDYDNFQLFGLALEVDSPVSP